MSKGDLVRKNARIMGLVILENTPKGKKQDFILKIILFYGPKTCTLIIGLEIIHLLG
jgi:hypothetical protein